MGNQIDKGSIVKKLTMNALEATLYGFLLFILIVVILGLLYIGLWSWEGLKEGIRLFVGNIFYFLLIIIVGIIFHEALHGLTWARFCKKGMQSIKFGLEWKYLMPYAHCKEYLTVRQYSLGAMMPGVVLGVVPSAIALITGNAWLMCFGLFFTGIAGGDMLVLWNLKGCEANCLIQDHPDDAGFVIVRNNLNKNEDEDKNVS